VEHSVKELKKRLAEAEKMKALLGERFAQNPEDGGVFICLKSADEQVQDIRRELRLVECAMPPESLDGEREPPPCVKNLSDVETPTQLLGYYVAMGLEKLEDKINALKNGMSVLGVLGETEVSPAENLKVLEDAVLLGYWKAFHHAEAHS